MHVATHAVIYELKFLFLNCAAEKYPSGVFFQEQQAIIEEKKGNRSCSWRNQYEEKT